MTGNPSVAGIILAAGSSSRMGSPKQLMRINGRTILDMVVRSALESRLDRVVLVLGHKAEKAAAGFVSKEASRLEVVINREYKDGQSTSLKKGLNLVKNDCSAAMFLLGDQPFISPEIINRLIDAWVDSDKEICVPVHKGRRGAPALFSSSLFPDLLSISGDRGGRDIIKTRPDSRLDVPIDDPIILFDLDSKEDIDALKVLRPDLVVEFF